MPRFLFALLLWTWGLSPTLVSSEGLGMSVSLPGNTIIDQVLINAQTTLQNLTKFRLPEFKYKSPLVSVTIHESTVEGLVTFHRVGDISLDIHPLGKNTIKFGFGWTELIGTLDFEVYFFQFGMSLLGDSGKVQIKVSNFSSVQGFSWDPLGMSLSVDSWDLGLGDGTGVDISGLGPGAKMTGQIVTGFIQENKNRFLPILSYVTRFLVNSIINGLRTIILPSWTG